MRSESTVAPETASNPAMAGPRDLVDALHSAFGSRHVRAVHAKGIIVLGRFVPDPQASEIVESPVFAGDVLPVTGRFSDFTGLPAISDTAAEASPRGFAFKIRQADGSEADVVSHSFNGFPTRTSDEFGQLMRAIGASGPEVPHPTPLETFLELHPVAKSFLGSQKAAPLSYATLSYFGVNAFEFTNASGQRSMVRYQFIPVGGEVLLDAEALPGKGPDYLRAELVARITAGTPVGFDWLAQVGREGDDPEDPSTAWPASRRLVRVGTLWFDRVQDEPAADQRLLFLPGNTPANVRPLDPMVRLRTSAYPLSFSERQ